ncbi:hypothetical protein [Picosynechococcus sp. NKBG15041c]|uniref:hypothetical protein n=1 Tax=Picosynechococcus sp. NKBG15041c TaxID=1407650 RepID=UPI00040C5A2F|nr:hypothetical protein [Picosynechococcus sp. NKBG15041c]
MKIIHSCGVTPIAQRLRQDSYPLDQDHGPMAMAATPNFSQYYAATLSCHQALVEPSSIVPGFGH